MAIKLNRPKFSGVLLQNPNTGDVMDDEDKIGTYSEHSLTPTKRWIVAIEIGDLPNNVVMNHLRQYAGKLQMFFPDKSCFVVPMRHGKPDVKIFEIEMTDTQLIDMEVKSLLGRTD